MIKNIFAPLPRLRKKSYGLGLLGWLLTVAAFGQDAPHTLRVSENFENPIGFYDATPSFSWKLPEGVTRQAAYQIQVHDRAGDTLLWDSRWVDSDQSVYIPYEGPKLHSRQQLSWRVRAKDAAGRSLPWSEAGNFELGLLSKADWEAKWIRPWDGSFSAADFKLIKAVYRSKTQPEKSRDVTGLLQQKVGDGALVFRVDNETLGGDPAYEQRKELVVTYRAEGKEVTQVLEENQAAHLPMVGNDGNEYPVTYLRREFPVDGSVVQARLYVTARGVYRVAVNGQRVGDDELAPGWTAYADRIETRAYDVGDLLRSGDNALGALLGSGWYAGRITWRYIPELRGRKPELLLQLEITYENGRTETIVSDRNWKATRNGPIRMSSIYEGETYDARMEMPGWASSGFDAQGWRPVVESELDSVALSPKTLPPVKVIEERPVERITESGPGRYILDMGQNMVGGMRIRVPVRAGQPVKIRVAEQLNPDGSLHTDNYRSAKSTGLYIPAENGVIEWQPVFTFFGFQFVELSGLPEGLPPEKDWFTGLVMHTAMERTGHFQSSHPMLNQLQSNIVWGQRGNFLEVPTDCPQRDERFGWTGDAQVFCATSLFNYDCHAFWKSWLATMREEQAPDGSIPDMVPVVLKNFGTPAWQDAATIVPWAVYVRTGDAEVLAQNYSMMEGLVSFYASIAEGDLYPLRKGHGDWLQPYREKSGITEQTYIGSAFYANSVHILARSAEILGKTGDAERYREQADRVRDAFLEKYFDASGRLQNTNPTQTSYLLAVAFDLLPETMLEGAKKGLLEQVDVADGHLRTGFLGTPFITSVLDELGAPAVASSILFKESYPSWFYSIKQGATTMWERWNSYSKAEGFNGESMNSLNHYAYGAIGLWMYERLGGLAPDPANPGYKHFYIQPLIIGQLDAAEATLETRYGTASSAWRKEGDRVTMEVTVPPNTTATVIFPNGDPEQKLNPGSYRFSLTI